MAAVDLPGALPYPAAAQLHGVAGPAVVLVHGTPLDQRSWAPVAERLAQRRRRVVTYDLRGHGSARETPLPDGFAPLADDLAALLDRLGAETAHVVGHSFGGQVAQQFALARPQRLASLSIVCARLVPFPPFDAVADQVDAAGVAPLSDGLLERWFGADAVAAATPAVTQTRAALAAADPAAYATALRLIAAYDDGPRMAEVEAPLLVLAAEHDGVATAERSQVAAALAPHGRFELLADATHMAPVAAPDRVAALLDAALPTG